MRAWGTALLVTGLAAGFLPTTSASALAGAEVSDGQLPFVAKVTFGIDRDQRSCTGVLIDSRWIATAKTCFTDGSAAVVAGAPAKPTSVLIGRTDLTRTTGFRAAVQSIVPHADRNVVLARLTAPVEGIAPVKLGGAAQVGETLRIAGYGRTATEWVPDRLHASAFTVESAGTSTFAVSGAAICKGDAGGPALRETSGGVELVGLNDTSTQKGCLAESATSDGVVEARVDDLATWVRVTTAEQPQGLRDPVSGEFNRDSYQDLIAADSVGKLWLYPGTATRNAYAKRVEIGSGWGDYREFAIGKVNRDQYDDLITIESSTGKLWLYPGTATGGRFGTRSEYGSGWQPFRDIAIGRVNADQYDDLLTVRDTDSKLFLYKGNSGGVRFDAGVEYGSGWSCCAQVTLGRFNTDAYDDLLTIDKSTGKLRLYAGRADGSQFDPSVDPGAGATWGSASYLARGKFDDTGLDGLLRVDASSGATTLTPRTAAGGWGTAVPPLGQVAQPTPADLTKLAVGELNRDAWQDLIGVDSAGVLWLYPGTASRTWGSRVQIGTNWNTMRELVVARANRDNFDDVIALETSTAKQFLYPGTAAGTTLGARQEIGSGWGAFRDITIGHVNHDAWDDLLGVTDADNKLYLYKGNSAGGHFDAGVAYGTGWQCCTQLTLGSFTDDGWDDLVTVDKSTGKLRLYVSKDDGSQFEPGVDSGAGDQWKERTELVAVQFGAGEHDSLLAKDPSGDILLYPTTEAGTPQWNDPIHIGQRD